jgi:hypothetical protein
MAAKAGGTSSGIVGGSAHPPSVLQATSRYNNGLRAAWDKNDDGESGVQLICKLEVSSA